MHASLNWKRLLPATPRHTKYPLPLLPSGPDGTHKYPIARGPTTVNIDTRLSGSPLWAGQPCLGCKVDRNESSHEYHQWANQHHTATKHRWRANKCGQDL